MIVFDLECLNGHTFEGWFEDKADLEQQQNEGTLTCPICDETSVTQKVHPIAIKTSSNSSGDKMLQARQEVLFELSEKMIEYVDRNYEDVGADFAESALKMHYGVQEFKNIKGTTTKEEEKVLEKEGVPVFKIPVPDKTGEDLN